MENKQKVKDVDIREILGLYGITSDFCEKVEYISYNGEHGDDLVKNIFSVLLKSGNRIVIKILREHADLDKDRTKIENQSRFSEFMREKGIRTPKRYMANGRYCNQYIYNTIPCNVIIEDWCGEEIKEINTEIAYKIGELMARMHMFSLKNECRIGCGTLFSAAYWNDVDGYRDFCRICEDTNLDQAVVEAITKLRSEKLDSIRAVWDLLPKAAVQGDVSINNLVYDKELIIFDYNNAGDEVLVSDFVMEGLLTAYEMDIPKDADERYKKQLFRKMVEGYLSVRKLSRLEADTAWTIYTLYNALWFSKIVYSEDSLKNLVKKKNYESANRLLNQILSDLSECNDGRFEKQVYYDEV